MPALIVALTLVACTCFAEATQDTIPALVTTPQPAASTAETLAAGTAAPQAAETAQEPILHVIWDDDGSPDGVIALLYFLQTPHVEVDAITVSCGEAHPNIFAIKLARMLARLGRSGIPIAAGRATPLEGDNAFPESWRAASDAFWGIALPAAQQAVQPQQAAELIAGVLHASPSPVTVFVSGNHTNLAEALRLDTSIAGKISSVQVMGGALFMAGNIESDWPEIHNRVAEWNIWVDPIAASEVLGADLSIGITPLDATNQVLWTEADAAAWDASGTAEGVLAAEILRWMLGSWYPEGVYVWDLVAAVNATDPALCEQEELQVRVVTEPGDEEGRTVVVGGHSANVTACLEPQAEAMKDLVADTFGTP
jgi:pyrimidine-specific ribonucleoside hydrolase